MLYSWIKWLHILSSTVLFGTGAGIAFFHLAVKKQEGAAVQAAVLRIVVLADWCFTTPAVILQPLTGLWLVHIAGYSLDAEWLRWALTLYVLAGLCWLPVLWLQWRMRALAREATMRAADLPAEFYRYHRLWIALGVPAFVALLVVFYLMVFKPT
jgi:uncharacterized membrane protein